MSTADERSTGTTTGTNAGGSTTAGTDVPGGRMHVPRSRGALSGILLIVLGAWGALIPFVGPYFNFSFTPDAAWHWTSARGWLEVLPGVAAALGGLLSLVSAHRAVISFGAWLGVAAGAWFIVGRDLADAWNIGSPGVPAGSSTAIHTAERLAMFTGLGAVILFVAASAVGRLSVTSLRDVRVAQRRAAKAARRDRPERDSSYERGRRDGLAAAGTATTGNTGTTGDTAAGVPSASGAGAAAPPTGGTRTDQPLGQPGAPGYGRGDRTTGDPTIGTGSTGSTDGTDSTDSTGSTGSTGTTGYNAPPPPPPTREQPTQRP